VAALLTEKGYQTLGSCGLEDMKKRGRDFTERSGS
jgi:hypothetical protein